MYTYNHYKSVHWIRSGTHHIIYVSTKLKKQKTFILLEYCRNLCRRLGSACCNLHLYPCLTLIGNRWCSVATSPRTNCSGLINFGLWNLEKTFNLKNSIYSCWFAMLLYSISISRYENGSSEHKVYLKMATQHDENFSAFHNKNHRKIKWNY